GGKRVGRVSRLVAACSLAVVMCCLLAADIQFDQNSPVPNPNNTPFTIQASGTFTLNKNESVVFILLAARNTKTNGITFQPANYDAQNFKWDAITYVAPGNYECWGVLGYMLPGEKEPKTVETKKVNLNVK
ncbi:MAG: hypothetical protein NZ703_14175, partial [Gemmataceae bacterium]|nr:hypothetical protein [Gemmataceae bacterium]